MMAQSQSQSQARPQSRSHAPSRTGARYGAPTEPTKDPQLKHDTGAETRPVQTPARATADDIPWVPPTWEEIVAEHSGQVYRLAYRLTGNRFDAEDLTQEVFVRVFRSLSSYTPGTFAGWIHRITTNLFLDQMRRKQRIRFDGFAEDADDRMPGREPGPERSYEHNNLDYDVQRALGALPPDFRAAVVLCDLEGLSYEEVAATLGIKLGTVRSRIHRGRALLRQSLAHRAPTRGGAAVAPGAKRSRRRPTLGGLKVKLGPLAAGDVG